MTLPDVDVLAAAVRDLRARATALREDHPGCTDPLADALWEQCVQGEGHAYVYGDPRFIAAVALEHLATELARVSS